MVYSHKGKGNKRKSIHQNLNDKKREEKLLEKRLTYDDYANMPDDGIRYELADGVLEALSVAPHPIHQLVSYEISSHLTRDCQNEYIIFISPIDVILSENEVRQPDIVMIHQSKVHLVTSRGIEGSPDLVIEVLSPASIKRDREDKKMCMLYMVYRNIGLLIRL